VPCIGIILQPKMAVEVLLIQLMRPKVKDSYFFFGQLIYFSISSHLSLAHWSSQIADLLGDIDTRRTLLPSKLDERYLFLWGEVLAEWVTTG
jgi:hypothetical protein